MSTASKITHRRVLAIAIPIMLSNVSQPLIGVVDTAVIGRLPEPYYIGAIAIASLIFSFIYWGFGFLRLGTSGLTAQAFGADDNGEVVSVLGRAFLIAIGCGALLILLGPLIEQIIFKLIEGSAEVEENAAIYFRIRIWSAPFALMNFVTLGWFIGQGRARIALGLQLFLNVINLDIMTRTWCLVFAFWWHAAQGAKQGDVIVSANAVLMHCFEVAAYLIDGFAYAAEALVGQAVGAQSLQRFRDAAMISTVWAVIIGAVLAIIIFAAGPMIIDALAVNSEVRRTARIYLPWVALSSILGVVCFQLDGIFTGATRTADMRNMMIVSIAVYLAVWWVATRTLGNHGLWLALNVFFIVRAVTLGVRLPALEQASFRANR
jgi:MATE family multidrug resistance protein